MTELFHTPLWLFALVAAACGPGCVRFLVSRIEDKTRRRTLAVLKRAEEKAPARTSLR